MTQRQLNMLQSIQEGIELARADLKGPGGYAAMMEAIESDIFTDTYKPMSAGRLAYLACMIIAHKDAGCPDFN